MLVYTVFATAVDRAGAAKVYLHSVYTGGTLAVLSMVRRIEELRARVSDNRTRYRKSESIQCCKIKGKNATFSTVSRKNEHRNCVGFRGENDTEGRSTAHLIAHVC